MSLPTDGSQSGADPTNRNPKPGVFIPSLRGWAITEKPTILATDRWACF
jgi:hypothetical protein